MLETNEEKDLKEIKGKVDNLDTKLSQIYRAIMGDQFNEKGGYKHRLEDVEKRLEQIEDLITRWKWIVVGALGLGGYGGLTFIQQVISVIGKTIK